MAFDKFTRPIGVISVAILTRDDGLDCVAQFAFPTDAMNMVEREASAGWAGWFFTVRGETVKAADFVTREHAFRWLNDLSVYGHVTSETLGLACFPDFTVIAEGVSPRMVTVNTLTAHEPWHGQGERPPIPPLPSDVGLSRYSASNPPTHTVVNDGLLVTLEP